MQIDPGAWMFVVPVILILLWLYVQPAEHVVKRGWRELRRREAIGWARLGVDSDINDEGAGPMSATLFWTALGALSLVSVASFGAYMGLI